MSDCRVDRMTGNDTQRAIGRSGHVKSSTNKPLSEHYSSHTRRQFTHSVRHEVTANCTRVRTYVRIYVCMYDLTSAVSARGKRAAYIHSTRRPTGNCPAVGTTDSTTARPTIVRALRGHAWANQQAEFCSR